MIYYSSGLIGNFFIINEAEYFSTKILKLYFKTTISMNYYPSGLIGNFL